MGRGPRLAEEPLGFFGVELTLTGNLNGDGAVQFRVPCHPDAAVVAHAHPVHQLKVGHRLWLGGVVRIGFLAADEIELTATRRTRYVGEGIVVDNLHRSVTMWTADVHCGPRERHPTCRPIRN